MNRFRYAAPIIVPVAAVLAAFAIYALSDVLIEPATFWLIRHESIGDALAYLQFALISFSSAVVVALLTAALRRGDRSSIPLVEQHLRCCFLLYVVLVVSIISHLRCSECEGLVLGALKVYGLTALGGILGSLWALRRSISFPPAF